MNPTFIAALTRVTTAAPRAIQAIFAAARKDPLSGLNVLLTGTGLALGGSDKPPEATPTAQKMAGNVQAAMAATGQPG